MHNRNKNLTFFTREEVKQHHTENDYWTVIKLEEEEYVFDFSKTKNPPHVYTFNKMFTDKSGDLLADCTEKMNPRHFKTPFIVKMLMQNNLIGKIRP